MRTPKTPPRDDEWPALTRERPRVLIEEPDGALAWAQARELRAAGYSVTVCEGPDTNAKTWCALVRDGHCHLAEHADVVVCDVTSRDGSSEVLDALRSMDPERPILRTMGPQELAREHATLYGVTVLPFPLFPGELTDAVDGAASASTS